MNKLDLVIPPAELVDIETLRVDGDNPNKLSVRRYEAMKKSIRRFIMMIACIDKVNAKCSKRILLQQSVIFMQINMNDNLIGF